MTLYLFCKWIHIIKYHIRIFGDFGSASLSEQSTDCDTDFAVKPHFVHVRQLLCVCFASHLTGMSLQTLTPPCSVIWYGYLSFFRSYPSSLLFPFLFPSLLATHLPLKYLITCNGNIPLITLCKWARLLHTIKMKTPNINYIIKESCLMCQRQKKKKNRPVSSVW